MLGKRGRGRPTMMFLKPTFRDVATPTYLELQRAAGVTSVEGHYRRGLVIEWHVG